MATGYVPRVSDYTVAWICALSIEVVASTEMLDERHPFLPSQYTDDDNSYTLGKMGGHNVVIVSLSTALFSQVSSARLITETLRTFSGVRLCFSVGIGSGAWSPRHDIRLSDVVVSSPRELHGGVIQVDISKGSQYRQINSSLQLPKVLLIAMAMLQSRHNFEEPAMLSYLAELQNNQRIFRQPKGITDCLFDSLYPHQGSANGCSSCDHNKIILRPQRDSEEPAIHYGLIASSNQVLKNGEIRDQLAHKYDNLCFEMEASSLPAHIPCLLVRGISDYADSHKNNLWQGIAAAAAAAYAKELLSVIPPDKTLPPLLCRNMDTLSIAQEIPTKDRLFLVPLERNKHFAGREDILSKMRDLLRLQRCLHLFGSGGIGKTQIAVEYAYRLFLEDREVHILWISTRSSEQLLRGFRELARKLHLDVPGDDDPNILKAVLEWLQETDEKWLLILDDADEGNLDLSTGRMIQQFVESVSKFTRPDRAGVVMTRRLDFGGHLAYIRGIHVPRLPVADAVHLLHSYLEVELGDLEFEDLALPTVNSLGCNPLSIVLIAEYMNTQSTRLNTDLKNLYEHLKRFQKQQTHAESSSNVVEFVLDRYCENEPTSANFLFMLVMFGTAQIPEYLLRASGNGNTKPRPEVRSLIHTGLLTSSLDEKSFDLQRVVQYTVRRRLRHLDEESRFASEALALLADRFPGEDEERPGVCEVLVPIARATLGQDLPFDLPWESRTLLLVKLGSFDYREGRFDLALAQVSEACSVLREQGVTDDQSLTITAKDTLVSILVAQGKYQEAADIYQTTLVQKRKSVGNEHPETLRVSAVLARLYFRLGKLAEAEELLREAMEIRSRTLGSEHPDTLSVVSLLAFILSREGKYEEAEHLCRQTLVGYETLMGPQHPDTLANQSELVSILVLQGKSLEALDLAERVVKAFRVVLGEHHPDTLAGMNNLALILGETGRLKEAEELNLHVLELYEYIMGKDHASRLTSLNNLGRIYMLEDKLADSEKAYREEMTTSQKILGEDHPTANDSRMSLALVLEKQNRLAEARDLLWKASESLSRTRGPDHPTTVECEKAYQTLASSLSASPRVEEMATNLTPEDKLIAVMGPTGAGKSSFIQLFTADPVGIGNGLESFTTQVAIFPCKMPNSNEEFYLLDIPGFDDTNSPDQQIFRELSSWLTKTYTENIKLTGIIYLYRITDAKFTGAAMRNLSIFKKLCGDDNLSSVVLATTFWDQVDNNIGVDRENQLKNTPVFWGSMIDHGSCVFRHDSKEESGTAIIQYLLNRGEKKVYAIQDEMVNQNKTLEETAAGSEVLAAMSKMRRQREQLLVVLKQDMEAAIKDGDREFQKRLLQERERLEEKLEEFIKGELQNRKKMQVDADGLWQQREVEREEERQEHMQRFESLQKQHLEMEKKFRSAELVAEHQRQLAELEKLIEIERARNEALKRSGFPLKRLQRALRTNPKRFNLVGEKASYL